MGGDAIAQQLSLVGALLMERRVDRDQRVDLLFTQVVNTSQVQSLGGFRRA